jgi:polar amino acid transport system substrate-binding protein
MRNFLVIISFLCFFSPVFACDENEAKDILSHYKWMTEDYPPYQFLDENNNMSGIYVDILFAIYQQLGVELKPRNIFIVPWARLYHQLQFDTSLAGFSMLKTPERSALFALVPLPLQQKISILIKENGAKSPSLSAIKNMNIAVVREDIGQQLLDRHNIKATQVETNSARSMLELLRLERVDAVAYSEDVASFQMKKLGMSEIKLIPILVLDDHSFNSYVFHRDTPKCVTDLFVKAIDELHQQGKLTLLWRKYLHNE